MQDVFQEHEVFHVHPELRCGLFIVQYFPQLEQLHVYYCFTTSDLLCESL